MPSSSIMPFLHLVFPQIGQRRLTHRRSQPPLATAVPLSRADGFELAAAWLIRWAAGRRVWVSSGVHRVFHSHAQRISWPLTLPDRRGVRGIEQLYFSLAMRSAPDVMLMLLIPLLSCDASHQTARIRFPRRCPYLRRRCRCQSACLGTTDRRRTPCRA